MSALDPNLFREAMSRFASGVTVVTANRGALRFGVTASSFVSVSMEPPLVLVCLAKALHTLAVVEEARAFAVNILGGHQLDVGLRFAGMQPESSDRFLGLSCGAGVTGAPLIDGSLASLDCRLRETHDGGDHRILMGTVVHVVVSSDKMPLLYHDRLWRRSEPIALPGTPTRVRVIEGDPDLLRRDGVALVRHAFGREDAPPETEAPLDAVAKARREGAMAVCLEDTTGAATPESVRGMIEESQPLLGRLPILIALSDLRGLGLANVLSAFSAGVKCFVTGADGRSDAPVLTDNLLVLFKEMGVDSSVEASWQPQGDAETNGPDRGSTQKGLS